jgi:hypothetical protein
MKKGRGLIYLLRNKNLLLYIALSMLSNSKSSIRKTVVPELMYSLDKDDLLKLINMFGGENLYIPTAKEFKFFMQCALAGYYKRSQGQQWKWIKETMELSEEETLKIKEEVESWVKNCSKDELDLLKQFQELKGKVV